MGARLARCRAVRLAGQPGAAVDRRGVRHQPCAGGACRGPAAHRHKPGGGGPDRPVLLLHPGPAGQGPALQRAGGAAGGVPVGAGGHRRHRALPAPAARARARPVHAGRGGLGTPGGAQVRPPRHAHHRAVLRDPARPDRALRPVGRRHRRPGAGLAVRAVGQRPAAHRAVHRAGPPAVVRRRARQQRAGAVLPRPPLPGQRSQHPRPAGRAGAAGDHHQRLRGCLRAAGRVGRHDRPADPAAAAAAAAGAAARCISTIPASACSAPTAWST